MKGKKLKILSMLLTVIIIFSTACGKDSPIKGHDVQSDEKNKKIDSLDETDTSDKAMGRYIEHENSSISAYLSAELDIVRMNDGSFTIFDAAGVMLMSKDEGETWDQKSLKWYDELKDSSSIMDISVSPEDRKSVV